MHRAEFRAFFYLGEGWKSIQSSKADGRNVGFVVKSSHCRWRDVLFDSCKYDPRIPSCLEWSYASTER